MEPLCLIRIFTIIFLIKTLIATDLMITGGLDYRGKTFIVELFSLKEIPNLGIYGLDYSLDSSVSPSFNLDPISIPKGQFVYVTDNLNEFYTFTSGSTVTGEIMVKSELNLSGGQKSVYLYMDYIQVDVFGSLNCICDYKNGWYKRKNGTLPNGGIFETEDNWKLQLSVFTGATNEEASVPFVFGKFIPGIIIKNDHWSFYSPVTAGFV